MSELTPPPEVGTLPLKEYLIARRSYVFSRMQAIKTELETLDRERKQIDALVGKHKDDLYVSPSAEAEVAEGPPRQGVEAVGHRPSGPMTIKEAVLATMAHFPDGLRIQDLIVQMREKVGFEVAETSLWPQMNRLKNKDGKITNERGVWRLAKR